MFVSTGSTGPGGRELGRLLAIDAGATIARFSREFRRFSRGRMDRGVPAAR
jgi:hypothetical protein